jgi:hypothetical protein
MNKKAKTTSVPMTHSPILTLLGMSEAPPFLRKAKTLGIFRSAEKIRVFICKSSVQGLARGKDFFLLGVV